MNNSKGKADFIIEKAISETKDVSLFTWHPPTYVYS